MSQAKLERRPLTKREIMRGYSIIALDNPKNPVNIGAVLRLCGNYNTAALVVSGKRQGNKSRFIQDTMKAYRRIPFHNRVNNVLDFIPYDCVPIAVDMINGAIPLLDYTHPERGFYIFGAEDATLGKKVTDKCRDIIYIPSNRCLNLSMAVATVLYDRESKCLK